MYTIKDHEKRKEQLNELISYLVDLATRYDIVPSGDFVLVSSIDAGKIEVMNTHLFPGEKVNFFKIAWGTPDNYDYLDLQYNRETRSVSDSTRWGYDNSFKGGHIQITHNHSKEESIFLTSVFKMFKSCEGTWIRIPYTEREFN